MWWIRATPTAPIAPIGEGLGPGRVRLAQAGQVVQHHRRVRPLASLPGQLVPRPPGASRASAGWPLATASQARARCRFTPWKSAGWFSAASSCSAASAGPTSPRREWARVRPEQAPAQRAVVVDEAKQAGRLVPPPDGVVEQAPLQGHDAPGLAEERPTGGVVGDQRLLVAGEGQGVGLVEAADDGQGQGLGHVEQRRLVERELAAETAVGPEPGVDRAARPRRLDRAGAARGHRPATPGRSPGRSRRRAGPSPRATPCWRGSGGDLEHGQEALHLLQVVGVGDHLAALVDDRQRRRQVTVVPVPVVDPDPDERGPLAVVGGLVLQRGQHALGLVGPAQ